jgi:hypothetical protein
VTVERIDSRPQAVQIACYGGDPFDLTIRLRLGGSPADVAGWEWAARAEYGGAVIDLSTVGLPDGVQVTMPGADTASIAAVGRFWRFEVTGRDPAAGEARTLVEGWVMATARLAVPGSPATLLSLAGASR